LILSHTKWRDEDRGEPLLRWALYAEGFIPEKSKDWALLTETPTVRAEIWRRMMPRYPFAVLPE